jgi:predicted PurR-regulated permease PerM
MLEPLADRFQRRGRSRNAAVLLTLLTATLAVLLVLVLLLPGIYSQLVESAEKLPLALTMSRRRYSRRTESSDIYWMRQFILFHTGRYRFHPHELWTILLCPVSGFGPSGNS